MTPIQAVTEFAADLEPPALSTTSLTRRATRVPTTAMMPRATPAWPKANHQGADGPEAVPVVVWSRPPAKGRSNSLSSSELRENAFDANMLNRGPPVLQALGPVETRFSRSRRMVVACMEVRGPYDEVAGPMKELDGWLRKRGKEASGDPFCLFYDNPGETPPGELRSEVCVPVAEPFAPEGKVRTKVLEAADVAETRHRGPPEEFGRTYGPFLEGLLRQGFRLVGPAREFYASAADARGPGTGYLIQQPVSRC